MAALLSDAELLARLVGFDSTSSRSNRPIADFLCDYLDQPGVAIHRNELPGTDKLNVLVRVGGRDAANGSRAGVCLSGHVDVVPANEPDWHSDPFTLTERDDAYVGRGACDMKGFVALAVNAARSRTDRNLTHPLVLLLTCDEEIGSLGAMHLADSWDGSFQLPRSTIVGEPTSLCVVRMHKGHLKLRITIHGRSAHSGYPSLGVNAIEPAGRVITALSELRARLEAERCDTSVFFPETPYVALNVAQIQGGAAVNIVPDRCVIDVGVRPLPGMDPLAVADRVRSAVLAAAGGPACDIEIVHNNPPMMLPEDSATNVRLSELLGQRETVGVSYASDAGMLQQMGLECALFGPGTIEVAHKPNESLPKADFVQSRRWIDHIVEMWCM